MYTFELIVHQGELKCLFTSFNKVTAGLVDDSPQTTQCTGHVHLSEWDSSHIFKLEFSFIPLRFFYLYPLVSVRSWSRVTHSQDKRERLVETSLTHMGITGNVCLFPIEFFHFFLFHCAVIKIRFVLSPHTAGVQHLPVTCLFFSLSLLLLLLLYVFTSTFLV